MSMITDFGVEYEYLQILTTFVYRFESLESLARIRAVGVQSRKGSGPASVGTSSPGPSNQVLASLIIIIMMISYGGRNDTTIWLART